MEPFKKLIALLLVFSFTTQGLVPAAFAAEELDDEDEVQFVPTNPPGTPPGVQCQVAGVNPGPLGVCCVGFEKNRAGVCDEPTLVDPSLTSCTSSTECTGGAGCFPQSNEDLFSRLSASEDSDKASDLYAQINDQEEPIKENGASCVHSKQCKSYNCSSAGKCESKNVCRLADEGEVAGPGVNCGKDMVKNGSGVCQLTAEAKHGTYLGLLDEAVIGGDDKTCQFSIDDETKKQSIVAMQSLRAMEWLFSTISLDQKEECFDVLPTLKHEIGTTFFETRKNILTNFTDELNIIEFDFKQLIEAKENGTKQISIHKGEQISESDLATRQTSGYDSLVMMYRRNLLFQSYEQAMLETVKNANTKLIPMSEMLAALKDGDSNSPCEGSKYKTKKPLRSWKTKFWTKVKDHWATQYDVTGNAAGNADIIKREKVATVLALIGGKTKEEAIDQFTKSKHYLMDPLMFEGMRNGSYGETKKLKKKSSFLGLFGGFKDLRHAYYLRGSGSGSYTHMYNQLRPKLREFYKKLKVRGDQKGFVYEPELLTTEAKDCLDNPAKPEKCANFEPFLDDVMDQAFAHFIAWGFATKDSYEGFFSNAQTYRRALLRKLEVDMTNITKYYETVIAHRDRQNECIDRVINGLKIKDGVLAKDDSGIQEGGVYYDGSKDNQGNGLNLGKGNTALKTQKGNAIDRTKFTFDLKNGNLSKLADGTILDNVLTPGTTSSRAGVGDSASAFLASRGKNMKDANKKASALGVDVKSKEKAVKDSINALAKKSGSALGSSSGIAGAGGSSRGSGFGATDPGASAVGKGEIGEGSAGTGEGVNGGKGVIGLNSSGAGDGSGKDVLAGVDSGSGSGAGYDANGANGANGGDGANGANDPNARDGMGLTDAEREKMLSEAERNKQDYKGTEDDGLFGKVSKAYVRNLDKILIKKKKID